MKRSIIILMAASAIAAISCTKEIKDQPAAEKEQVTMSFDATIGTPTKVEIASSETAEGVTTHKLNWSVGDKIRVYSDNSSGVDGVEFTTDISDPSPTATFTGTVDAADSYYAFYPSSAEASWIYTHSHFSVNIPANQTPAGVSSVYAMAKADGNNLQFDHVTGLVKFKLLAGLHKKISKVVFSGNNSEGLAGWMKLYPERPADNELHTGHDIYSAIHLSPSEDNTFKAGIYYIMVSPASFENGITMTFIDEEGFVATKTSSNPAELKAGGILNLGGIGGQDLTFVGAYKHSLPWQEKFVSYNSANYQTIGDVAVETNYNPYAGGSSPELAVAIDASFIARIDVKDKNRDLTLTYKSNKLTSDPVVSVSAGAVLTHQGRIDKTDYYTIELDADTEVLTLTFSPTKMAIHMDDISLVEGMILPQVMSFSKESAQAMVGKSFTPPTLSGAKTTVTYSSSNPEVAEVDANTGTVTIKAAGKTTITANAVATETYFAGMASYILDVSAPIVGYSYIFTENILGYPYTNSMDDIRLYDSAGNVVVWKFSAVALDETRNIANTYDETKGQGFGADASNTTMEPNPRTACKEITLSTDGEYGHYEKKIEKIVLNACGGSGKVKMDGMEYTISSKITVTVNGVQYGNVETTQDDPKDFTFECPEGVEPQSGEIVINWKNQYGWQAKIMYLKSIQIHDYQ